MARPFHHALTSWIFAAVAVAWPQAGTAQPLTPDQARALKPGDSFRECEACPEMIVVPLGSFMMGSPADERGRDSDEGPQRQVTFSQPFAVGRFSVTFDEWDFCLADGGCNGYRARDERWGRGRRPVVGVTWYHAKTYIAWLSRKTGNTYRLLSEAEREYVTRAGTTTPYWWGSSVNSDQANFGRSSNFRTAPVDSFQPNPWGFYHVHGNVGEWMEDCYNDSYAGAPTDGSAWTSGNCKFRMRRGGSWAGIARDLRAAARDGNEPFAYDAALSFRVARTLAPR